MHLVQALATDGSGEPPRLWLVTRGAQPAGHDVRPIPTGVGGIAVAQAPIWGFGRAVAVEHPTLWGGLVDLDPAASATDDGTQLLRAMAHRDEDEVAIRGGRRYAARLVRTTIGRDDQRPIDLRADGTYLITGGLGDLGLVVARWMVGRGARRLILFGRTDLPDRATWRTAVPGSRLADQITAVRELEALGAEIITAGVDVADAAALRTGLAAVTDDGRPIRGVVHAAGTVHGGVLLNLDRASLSEVMRPKVTGGWLLHDLLSGHGLDFFVLFSAIPATVGWFGQGSANYAASNAFLDALAAYRRAEGRPALSIGWGPWAETGMAYRADGGLARLAGQGVGALSPAQARDTLDRLIGGDRTAVVVASIDWPAAGRVAPALAHTPLLRHLIAPASSGHANGRIRAELLAQPTDLRERWLRDYATARISEILQVAADRLDPDQPLSDVGLDSLMAIDLKNRLENDLDMHVPIVTFLQGPTVRQLATELAVAVASEPARPVTAPPYPVPAASNGGSDPASIRASVERLSDDEVELALARLDHGRGGPAAGRPAGGR